MSGIDKSFKVRLEKGKLDPDMKCLHDAFVVHSPYELPLSFNDVEFFEFSYGMNFEVLIEPEIIVSDANLETSYTKEERFCIFDGDLNLTYFKHYTQKNCEIECLTKFVIEECGCAPFYFLTDQHTLTCNT